MNNKHTIERQSGTIGCSIGCLTSIKANTHDWEEVMTPEQFKELQDIYDRLAKLQKWVVFNEH